MNGPPVELSRRYSSLVQHCYTKGHVYLISGNVTEQCVIYLFLGRNSLFNLVYFYWCKRLLRESSAKCNQVPDY